MEVEQLKELLEKLEKLWDAGVGKHHSFEDDCKKVELFVAVSNRLPKTWNVHS